MKIAAAGINKYMIFAPNQITSQLSRRHNKEELNIYSGRRRGYSILMLIFPFGLTRAFASFFSTQIFFLKSNK